MSKICFWFRFHPGATRCDSVRLGVATPDQTHIRYKKTPARSGFGIWMILEHNFWGMLSLHYCLLYLAFSFHKNPSISVYEGSVRLSGLQEFIWSVESNTCSKITKLTTKMEQTCRIWNSYCWKKVSLYT